MTSRPPREGARWGNDPPPEPKPSPAPEPGPPPEYLALCNEFGEPNVQHALQIHQKMKTEVPHASFVKSRELHFARVILENAKRSLEIAAKDGRPHTFPKTLGVLEGELSAFLLQNPNWQPSENFTLSFGDEEKGKVATKAKKERERKWDYWGFGVPAIFGIVTWSNSGSFGAGAVTAIGSFLIVAFLYGVFVGFDK